MLLKNKAPSLKFQNNCETISTGLCSTTENKTITKSVSVPKEVFEISNDRIEGISISSIDEEDLQVDSKSSFVEFNNVNSPHLQSGLDVVNANLSNNLSETANINLVPIKESKIDNIKASDRITRKRKFKEQPEEIISHANNQNEEPLKVMSALTTVSKKTTLKAPKIMNTGVYVECDMCNKTRYLKDVMDPSELPPVWTCNMEKNNELHCDIPQESFDSDFVNVKFTLGSVVWAKAPGFCWWPGIIDEDPDTNEFYWCYDESEDVSHYHVTFLDDEVSRSWILSKDLKVFRGKPDMKSMNFMKNKKNYSQLVIKVVERAEECTKLSLQECLNKYSFAVRYTGKPNLWTKGGKISLKRKSKSPNSELHNDTDRNESKENLEELSSSATVMEAESEVLLTMQQQSEHKQLLTNKLKENKRSTRSKSRRKAKKSG